MVRPPLVDRLVVSLAVLDRHLTRSDLERRLQLDRGYLGRCIAGQRRPGRALVLLLELLSLHPEYLDRIAD